MAKKVTPEKLAPIWDELMELDEQNRYCADCRAKAPSWASTNLGVFICIKCAGIHRSIGTHITKVKSIRLDGWEERQVDVMRRVGNTKAARIYLNGVPEDYPRPTEHSDGIALESWIRAKYERKQWFNKAAFDAITAGQSVTPSSSPSPAPSPAPAVVVPSPSPASRTTSADILSFDSPAKPSPSPSASASSSAVSFFDSPAKQAPQGKSPLSAEALFGEPVSAQPAAGTAAAASAAPKKDINDIMSLYSGGGMGGQRSTPPPMMQGMGMGMGMGGMQMQQPMQQQPMQMGGQYQGMMPMQQPQQQMAMGPQGGNYAVDLRAYGLYRNPGAAAQMTPQQQAYMQQQQMMMMQQQQQQRQMQGMQGGNPYARF